jgi:MFS transporter, ACS family, tartrate transporter
MLLLLLSPSPYVSLAALTILAIGTGSIQGPFWAMPTSMLTGAAAAGGIALINSVGNLGGFVGPVLMGKLKDATGGYQSGLICLAGLLLGASVLSVLARHDPAQERAMREENSNIEENTL